MQSWVQEVNRNNKETVFRHSISRYESSDISSLANSRTAVFKNSPELRRQEQRMTLSKISAEKRSSSPRLHHHRNHLCQTSRSSCPSSVYRSRRRRSLCCGRASVTWPSLELGTSGSGASSSVSSQCSTTKKVSYY